MTARRDHLAVASVSTLDDARSVIAVLAPHVGLFRWGSSSCGVGPAALVVVTARREAFVDFEAPRYPNTVKGAVGSLPPGASLCTIHASGGRAMIAAAAALRAPGKDHGLSSPRSRA